MNHHVPGHWTLPLPLTLLCLLFVILYFKGWRNLRANPAGKISTSRAIGFLSGLLLIWIAIGSPLAMLDAQLLTAHMVQHLLLMTIGPALLLLGAPLLALRSSLPQRFVQALLDPMFRSNPLQSVGKFLSNPIVCWLAASVTLILWHIPTIFAVALESPALHLAEHATFLFAGFFFWWPVIQPWPASPIWPRWPLLLYLFLATIPCDILSAYLTFSDRVVYTSYLQNPPALGFSVLQDQQFAGSLMWTCVTIIYLVPAAILTIRLLGCQPQETHSSGLAKP